MTERPETQGRVLRLLAAPPARNDLSIFETEV
jgi:hypothetical protein